MPEASSPKDKTAGRASFQKPISLLLWLLGGISAVGLAAGCGLAGGGLGAPFAAGTAGGAAGDTAVCGTVGLGGLALTTGALVGAATEVGAGGVGTD